MLITPRQIKAARGLLLWSQEQLADASGLSPRTIKKAESKSDPRQAEFVSYEVLSKIRKTLEDARIEFNGTSGVNYHEESKAKAFDGPDGPDDFYDYILATVKENGGELFAVYDTAETLARSLGEVDFNNLERLETISKYATVKCLLTNSEKSSLALPYFQVRAIPKFPFGYQSRIFCGDLHATIESVDSQHFSYYALPSLELAAYGINEFSSAWLASHPMAAIEPLKKRARA